MNSNTLESEFSLTCKTYLPKEGKLKKIEEVLVELTDNVYYLKEEIKELKEKNIIFK